MSCSDDDEKPRKRRRTNSSSSSPVLLKEVPKAVTPVTKTITVPVSGSPKMSSIMQSIANSLPPHMSPVKITFTKPSTQTTNTTTQKVGWGLYVGEAPFRSVVYGLGMWKLDQDVLVDVRMTCGILMRGSGSSWFSNCKLTCKLFRTQPPTHLLVLITDFPALVFLAG